MGFQLFRALLAYEHPAFTALSEADSLESIEEARERIARLCREEQSLVLDIGVRLGRQHWLWVCARGQLESHDVVDSLSTTEWIASEGAWKPALTMLAGHGPEYPLVLDASGSVHLTDDVDDYPIGVWIGRLAKAMRATTDRVLRALVANLEGERFDVRVDDDRIEVRRLFSFTPSLADGGRRFDAVSIWHEEKSRRPKVWRETVGPRLEATTSWDATRPFTTGGPRDRWRALIDAGSGNIDGPTLEKLIQAVRAPENADYEDHRRALCQKLSKELASEVNDVFLEVLRNDTDRVALVVAELAYQRPNLLARLRDELVDAVMREDETYAKRIKRCFKEALIAPDPAWLSDLPDAIRAKVAWRV